MVETPRLGLARTRSRLTVATRPEVSYQMLVFVPAKVPIFVSCPPVLYV